MNRTDTAKEMNEAERGMAALLAELAQAFDVYRQDLERYEQKKKNTKR